MSKTAIVYFSRKGGNYTTKGIVDLEKGNTKVVAEKLANLLNGDLFEIETENTYSNDYYTCVEQAKQELQNSVYPKLKSNFNLKDYDTVFLGYPNWWGTMPMAVFSFLKETSLEDKTVYPFCTHEGSGMGKSEQDLKEVCSKSIVNKGLAIKGSLVDNCDNDLKKWLNI